MQAQRLWPLVLLALVLAFGISAYAAYTRAFVSHDYALAVETSCVDLATCFEPYEEEGEPYAMLVAPAASVRDFCGDSVEECELSCEALGGECEYVACDSDWGSRYGACYEGSLEEAEEVPEEEELTEELPIDGEAAADVEP
jgi:hypothetical protein